MTRNFIKYFIIVFVLVFWTNLSFAETNNKPTSIKNKIIMIDLDGVLNNYTYYNKENMTTLKKGAKEFLKTLSNDYTLILFTSRNLKSTAKWLIENDIDKYFADITNIKRPAYLYIDDRAINFKGNYEKTIEDVNTFKTYWNNKSF